MAEKLEKEEFWKEMFILFDKEDRNFLTLDELKKFLQAVGVLVTNKELYKMLEEFVLMRNFIGNYPYALEEEYLV